MRAGEKDGPLARKLPTDNVFTSIGKRMHDCYSSNSDVALGAKIIAIFNHIGEVEDCGDYLFKVASTSKGGVLLKSTCKSSMFHQSMKVFII